MNNLVGKEGCVNALFIFTVKLGMGSSSGSRRYIQMSFCLLLLYLLDGERGGVVGGEGNCQGKCADKMKAGKQAELLEIT